MSTINGRTRTKPEPSLYAETMPNPLKQDFKSHLAICDQCKHNPMNLCNEGDELLANRSYDMPEKAETGFCYTCRTVKPKAEVETREKVNVDGQKGTVTRCLSCWERRSR